MATLTNGLIVKLWYKGIIIRKEKKQICMVYLYRNFLDKFLYQSPGKLNFFSKNEIILLCVRLRIKIFRNRIWSKIMAKQGLCVRKENL